MQRTSAGLGHHCFASDDRFQPVLLCGLFAAPSGFHNQSSFFSKQQTLDLQRLQADFFFSVYLPYDATFIPREYRNLNWPLCSKVRKTRLINNRSVGLLRMPVRNFAQPRQSWRRLFRRHARCTYRTSPKRDNNNENTNATPQKSDLAIFNRERPRSSFAGS